MGVAVEQPVPTNEISSSTYTIDCETELPIHLTGTQNSTATSSYNYIWQKSTDQNTWQPMGNGPNIDIIQLPNESIYIRRIIAPTSCEPHTSNVIFLEIESSTDPGTITGGSAYCASESPAPLVLTDYDGEIIQWEKSENNINYTVINGTSETETIVPDAITGTTFYRALVQKGGCDPEYSSVNSVTIYPEMVNIIDAVDQEVCAGEIPEPITGNDPEEVVSDGTSVLWLSKQIGDENWGNYPEGAIVNNSSLVFTQPLSETTIITRLVTYGNADCSSYGDSVIVYVSPQTDAGDFSDNDNQQLLCSGEEGGVIVLEDYTGEIIDWYSSTTSPNGPWSSLGVNNDEHTPGQIFEDTYFHVKVQSGVCDEDSSEVYSIQVTPQSEAGNFTDPDNSQKLCPGSIPDPIVLENYTGMILNWYMASDSLGDWTALDHVSPEYQPEALDQDTYYKVEVQSGACAPVLSDVYSIEFYGPILNNTISSDTTLCAGEPTPMLTGGFPDGGTQTHTLLWQQWTSTSGWVDAAGDNNDQNYSPGLLEETTHFRRIVSGECPSDTSNTVVVEIVEQPTATLSGGGYYCPGEAGTDIFVHFEGTPPFDFSLYDGQDTTTVYDINTNEHTITVTADSITTYTLISVSNAYCGVDGGMVTSSVEIIPIPAIGDVSAGPDNRCMQFELHPFRYGAY